MGQLLSQVQSNINNPTLVCILLPWKINWQKPLCIYYFIKLNSQLKIPSLSWKKNWSIVRCVRESDLKTERKNTFLCLPQAALPQINTVQTLELIYMHQYKWLFKIAVVAGLGILFSWYGACLTCTKPWFHPQHWANPGMVVHACIILALGRQRQENHKLKVTQNCTVSSRTAWVTWGSV